MSANNGVIRIIKRSLRKFQFGEEEPVVTLDVIEVSDQWHEINFALRVLEGDSYVLPSNKVNEFAVNRLNFVQGLVAAAYPEGSSLPTLSRIEAEEFILQVQKEAGVLRNFTSVKSEETSSAPESTATAENFSQ